jgi:hypothetical protein
LELITKLTQNTDKERSLTVFKQATGKFDQKYKSPLQADAFTFLRSMIDQLERENDEI